jgi:hypothetical protein
MFCFIDRRRRRGIILSIVIGRSIHHIGNHGERYERVTWQPIVQYELLFALAAGCWLLAAAPQFLVRIKSCDE